MKITLLIVICFAVAILQGFALGTLFPGPLGVVFAAVLGWLFGYYIVTPVIIKEWYK